MEPSLRNDALTKLKLSQHPPTAHIMPLLARQAPTDPALARQWFEYLAGRIADFSQEQFGQLQNMPIIPATPPSFAKKDAKRQFIMMRPRECFFRGAGQRDGVHSKLFTFVDFGNKANNFLRACGVKNEPNIQEIADLLVQDPKRFLELAGGPLV